MFVVLCRELGFCPTVYRLTPSNSVHTGIPPDAATCPNCVNETLDPSSRWYRYPFTNCTHCGPRLSIVRSIPYDRHHTSMADFPMCPDCRQEYEDVTNRRFHAQPVAFRSAAPKYVSEASSSNTLAVPVVIDSSSMWRSLLEDLSRSVPVSIMTVRFYLGLAQVIAQVVHQLRSQYSFIYVALTGGVFQNPLLAQSVTQQLSAEGLMVLQHSHVPANDGGLSREQVASDVARSVVSC